MFRTAIAAVTTCALIAVNAGPAYAQAAGAAVPAPTTVSASLAPAVFDVEPLLASARTTPQAPPRKGISPTAIGALIGAGAAAGVTTWAASRRGENEGGEFCVRCWVEWSAIGIPIGAGLGAAIGWGIGRGRRSVNAMPIVTPRARGIVLSARF